MITKQPKIIIRLLLFFFILIFFFSNLQAGGYWHWWKDTPGDNQIIHDLKRNGIEIICLENGGISIITHLNKWYFYKGYIVGEFQKNKETIGDNQNRGYFFIFNERSCEIKVFDSKASFNKIKKELNLIPFFWTRWYKDEWSFFMNSGNFERFFLRFFVILPFTFIVIVWFLIHVYINRRKLNFKRPQTLILSIITFCITFRFLLEIFPSSI